TVESFCAAFPQDHAETGLPQRLITRVAVQTFSSSRSSVKSVNPDRGIHDLDAESSPELDAIREAFPTLRWELVTRTDEGWDHVVIICRGCSGEDALGYRDLEVRLPSAEHALAQRPPAPAVLDSPAPRAAARLPGASRLPPSR